MARARAHVSSYLVTTADGLRDSLSALPAERAEAHAKSVVAFRRARGGFAGRAGDDDLYYTDFAVRALHALGRLDADIAAHADAFARGVEPRGIIDVANRLSIALLTDRVAPDERDLLDVVQSHRNADGGYGKTPLATAGSTYHTFLAVACHDALGVSVPQRRSVGRFLRSRLQGDGGFGETGLARRGSTNPTAAAVATGMMLGLRSGRAARRVGKFMASMRDESGGWRASALSPCADIMSTYTGLTTLSALGTADRSVVTLARAFCGACERNGGGFGAMPLDTGVDVEYTYYGLGVRGLLAGLAGESQ